MKNLFIVVIIAAFSAGICAQELDSLQMIMDKNHQPESQEDTAFAPVIIEDKGDEVKIKVLDKEVVKVVENEDTTYVKIGDEGLIQVTDQPDSTFIRVWQ